MLFWTKFQTWSNFNIIHVFYLNRNPYDFSDSDSDDEEEDEKTKKKKKKRVIIELECEISMQVFLFNYEDNCFHYTGLDIDICASMECL